MAKIRIFLSTPDWLASKSWFVPSLLACSNRWKILLVLYAFIPKLLGRKIPGKVERDLFSLPVRFTMIGPVI